MPSFSTILSLLLNPQDLRAVIQWKVWHIPVHERDEAKETATLKKCFEYLDLTSRSFSAVIKELNHELLVPITLFYLCLRGLDTIEDDMTIPIDIKEPMLRDFHTYLDLERWNFTGSGPNEKDRELLVGFDNVIVEFRKIKPAYRTIIQEITRRMGSGMADYQVNGMVDYKYEKEGKTEGIITVEDYETYCHHVAGIVGEGLTRLFVESGLANPALLQRPDLHESMGQLLQQVNIIRDIREDYEDQRRFWPKSVWSKYVSTFDDLLKPENREAAMQCSSEMILMALDRADDCLFYLAGLKDQSVFNFAAIPQSMAIATLERCFRNPELFDKNLKISKGTACRLMIASSQNLQILYGAFREYAQKIHKKNDPRDPNFLKISIACGKIEQFTESVFPTQAPNVISGGVSPSTKPLPADLARKAEEEAERRKDVFMMLGAVGSVVGVMSVIMIFIAWVAGARFDLVWNSVVGAVTSNTTSPSTARPSIKHEL